MKNLRNTITALVAFITLFSVQAQKNENSLLWKVEGKDIKTSYVFGTFHMLPKEDFILKDNVKTALEASELTVLELDYDDPAMQTDMAKFSVLPEGKTLEEFVDKEEYTLIDTYFKNKMGIGFENLKTLKPFVVSAMVMTSYLGKEYASPEATLVGLSKEQQKEIKGLETVESQLSIFDNLPFDEQIDEIVSMLDENNGVEEVFNTMIAQYKKEDIDELYRYVGMGDLYSTEAAMDAILHDRNENWIPQIVAYSKKQKVFYGVGAGHLGGKKGVINLLREAGYKVTPVLD